jgi:hypothetical protein
LYRYAAGIAVLLLSFWGGLFLFDDRQRIDPDACPAGEMTTLSPPYSFLNGHAYKAKVPSLAGQADSASNLFVSPVRLCEDKMLLGPPHTYHAEIVGSGFGRFSHFGEEIVFSSSDNSDPNANGRKYVAVIPLRRR